MDITPLIHAIERQTAADALGLQLRPQQWQRLAGHLSRRELQPGELLWNRGDDGSTAIFVEQGQLQVFVRGGPPGSHRIAVLGAGAVVGEPALFVKTPRMASVEATTPCAVWALAVDSLPALAAAEPALVLSLLQAAGAQMALRMRANLERGIPTA